MEFRTIDFLQYPPPLFFFIASTTATAAGTSCGEAMAKWANTGKEDDPFHGWGRSAGPQDERDKRRNGIISRWRKEIEIRGKQVT